MQSAQTEGRGEWYRESYNSPITLNWWEGETLPTLWWFSNQQLTNTLTHFWCCALAPGANYPHIDNDAMLLSHVCSSWWKKCVWSPFLKMQWGSKAKAKQTSELTQDNSFFQGKKKSCPGWDLTLYCLGGPTTISAKMTKIADIYHAYNILYVYTKCDTHNKHRILLWHIICKR